MYMYVYVYINILYVCVCVCIRIFYVYVSRKALLNKIYYYYLQMMAGKMKSVTVRPKTAATTWNWRECAKILINVSEITQKMSI